MLLLRFMKLLLFISLLFEISRLSRIGVGNLCLTFTSDTCSCSFIKFIGLWVEQPVNKEWFLFSTSVRKTGGGWAVVIE